MPNPATIAFFESNKNDVGALIERANVKRSVKNLPPLTEVEIDRGIEDMIGLKATGQPITGFLFPDPPPGTPPARVQPQPALQSIEGARFNFEIIKCSNGFLMNMKKESKSDTFIFKELTELSCIFNEVLFESNESKFENIDGKSKRKKL